MGKYKFRWLFHLWVVVLIIILSGCGGSGKSSSTATAPLAPTELAAVAGDGQVVLIWKAATEATSYQILSSQTSGTGYTAIGVSNTTNYTATNLTNGTKYYFVVKAVNNAGSSGYSNEANAIPSKQDLEVSVNNTPVTTCDFGAVEIGTQSAVVQFKLTNTGSDQAVLTPGSSMARDRLVFTAATPVQAGGSNFSFVKWEIDIGKMKISNFF